MSDSVLLRKSEAMPEKRTGVEKTFSARRQAMGLARWCLDIPMRIICPKERLWLTILWCIWGRFPEIDLRTPTCSAVVANSMGVPAIWRGESCFVYLV